MDDEITEEQEQIDTDEEGISEELAENLVKEHLQKLQLQKPQEIDFF